MPPTVISTPAPSLTGLNPADRRRLMAFAVYAAVLGVAFALPLFQMLRFGLKSTMYSHVVLVPFISGYLIWQRRSTLPSASGSAQILAGVLALTGVSLLAWYFLDLRGLASLPRADRLAPLMLAFVCFLWSGGLLFLGHDFMRAIAFPAVFLVFLVPIPSAVEAGLETVLQRASAEAAAWLFQLTGLPFFRDGQVFHLPGMTLVVAQECSGINSSFVLFVTSLLAGHIFLRKPWKKVALALFVIPLGIARNAFRIVTIGWLCVQVSPDMIHSQLHRRGGPIFFALSLVPFLVVLLWLRRGEGAEKRG